jgi:Tfp pilus assembly protein PilN
MSVRVNLLPRETYARQAASRQRNLIIAGFGVLVLLLGLVQVWQMNRVSDARDELAVEEALVGELEQEIAALSEFEDLRTQLEDADEALRSALQHEATAAGILQDFAAVMPSDAQLDNLSVSLMGAPTAPDGVDPSAIGSFTLTGKTLTSHAPGVERFLLSLDKVAAFFDLFVNTSSLQAPDESDVATFSVEGEIGSEMLTGRYTDGLPEDLR